MKYLTPILIILASIQNAFFFLNYEKTDLISVEAFCDMIYTFQSFMKSVTMIWNLKKILNTRNRLNVFYEKFGKDEKEKSVTYLKNVRKIFKTLFIFIMTNISCYNLFPLLATILQYNMYKEKFFPIKMWFPFDPFNYYWTIYVYNLYLGYMYMATHYITDHYLALIVFDLVAHFDRLGENFKTAIDEAPNSTLKNS